MKFENTTQLRIAKIRQKMGDLGLDALYLRGTTNLAWATGFDGVFDEEKAHLLLVTPTQVFLHTDSRYSVAFANAAEETEVVVSDRRVSHLEYALEALGTWGSGFRLGIEDTCELREFRAMEARLAKESVPLALVETTGLVESLRECKDAVEIGYMRKAQAVTDAGFAHICSYIKEGMTERQVQRELDRFMLDLGADGLAFPTIVATGAHGASPHAQPGDTVIKRGDAVVMDFGARVCGYCSDMTRTVFMGMPCEELRQAWTALRRANEECEALVRAGVPASSIHAHAEEVLAQDGYAGKMGHGLGHSLGLDIHESPALSPRNKAPLAAGVVVTVEPGIYLAGKFGMRLEDFGVVTDDGFDVLTQSTHEMVIIGDCE